MQRIRKLYLKEIENDIEFKWSNRERLLMDLKLFKAWHPEEWKGMSEDDLFRHFMDYFRRDGFEFVSYHNEMHLIRHYFSLFIIESTLSLIQTIQLS